MENFIIFDEFTRNGRFSYRTSNGAQKFEEKIANIPRSVKENLGILKERVRKDWSEYEAANRKKIGSLLGNILQCFFVLSGRNQSTEQRHNIETITVISRDL